MGKSESTGQFKINLETGKVTVVGSKQTERPQWEKQASLLDWGDDTAKLEAWKQGAGPKPSPQQQE